MSRARVLRRQGAGLATAASLILLLGAAMMLTTHAGNVATATRRHRKARVDRQYKQPGVVAALPSGVQTSTHTTQRRETILEDQMHMLSTGQREKLRKIEAGAVRKHEVELVLARYEEDVSWARMYSNILTVYNKGRTDVLIDGKDATLRGAHVVNIDNVGRESHSLLHHIVENYDKNASSRTRSGDRYPGLAEVTVFAHGGPPSQGYSGPDSGGGHLNGNVSLHDYILHDGGRFIFTSAMRLTDGTHIVRAGYNKGTVEREEALQMCPPQSLDIPGSFETRFPFCHEDYAMHLCRLIGTLCRDEDAGISMPSTSTLAGVCSPLGFWQRWVRLPRPPHDVVFFAQGAVFSFTRDQVRKRPKSYYQGLLRAAQGEEFAVKSTNRLPEERKIYGRNSAAGSSTGFFLEWFWYYILTSSQPECPVSGAEFDFATVTDFSKLA